MSDAGAALAETQPHDPLHLSEYYIIQLLSPSEFEDHSSEHWQAWLSATGTLNNHNLPGLKWSGWTKIRERPAEIWLISGKSPSQKQQPPRTIKTDKATRMEEHTSLERTPRESGVPRPHKNPHLAMRGGHNPTDLSLRFSHRIRPPLHKTFPH
jgi:hypothetical protein